MGPLGWGPGGRGLPWGALEVLPFDIDTKSDPLSGSFGRNSGSGFGLDPDGGSLDRLLVHC